MSTPNKTYIRVSQDPDSNEFEPQLLETLDDGNITLETVREFFKGAAGLMCRYEDCWAAYVNYFRLFIVVVRTYFCMKLNLR